MTKYIDRKGQKYQVMGGIRLDSYKARYQKTDKTGRDGWHGVRSLPWRDTKEKAQADLDALAKEKGWEEWEG